MQMENIQINKRKFIKLYIWLFAGILLAAGVGLMKVGGTLDVHNPLNQERVYDVAKKEFTTSTKSWIYDTQSGTYTVQSAKSGRTFTRIPESEPFKYLNISISNLGTESSIWGLVYYDAESHKLAEQTVTVVNGENLIPIGCTESFRRLRIKIADQPGLQFSINAMQLRMNNIGFSKEIFVESGLAAFGIYLLISFLIFLGRRIRGKAVLGVLQHIYTLPGDYLGSRITARLSDGVVGAIQTFLFSLLFLIAPVMNVCGIYNNQDYYKYGILGCVVVLVLIALLAWERPLEKVKWQGVLPFAWFWLWGWICLSDLIVGKDFSFTGYVFLFAVGFFFFMWSNMEKPKRMMNHLVHGLEWTFPVVVIYTLICRKRYVGVLYNGAFANREDMSLYALVILIVFLTELYFVLYRQAVNHRRERVVAYGMGISLAIYYLYRAYTLTCILAGVIVCMIFIIRLVRRYRQRQMGVSKTAGMLVLALACSGALVFAVNQLNMTLPDTLGTNLVYQNEYPETNLSAEEMAAIEEMAPGYFDDIAHTTEKDRNLIWKNYLRKLNFFGNESGRLRVGQAWEFAENSVLQMVYRYGIFVLIPYLLLLFANLYYSWKRKGYLMFTVTLAFGMVLLTQNVEQPFLQPIWILFYLGMGEWFIQRR